MQHVGNGLVPDAGVVNHIRHIRVGNVHQQGCFVRVVAVVPLVRENNAVSLSALQHPLPEPPIKRVLALILQGIRQPSDFLTVTCCRFRPHIRARRAAHITCVEAHTLVGVVFYNAVRDFSVIFLRAEEDRLTAQVVVVQKANLILVQQMNRLRLAHDHLQHVCSIDFRLRRFNRSASGQRIIQKAANNHLILSHVFLLSSKIKKRSKTNLLRSISLRQNCASKAIYFSGGWMIFTHPSLVSPSITPLHLSHLKWYRPSTSPR